MTKRAGVVQSARNRLEYYEEGGNNVAKWYNYYRTYTRIQEGCPTCATCAAAVYTWFAENGLKPQLKKYPTIAKSWLDCPVKMVLGASTTAEKIKAIQVASVNIYRHGSGFHVGLVVEKFPLYCVTREANTGSESTLHPHKKGRQGEFFKIRSYQSIYVNADWIPYSDPLDAYSTKFLQTLKNKYYE